MTVTHLPLRRSRSPRTRTRPGLGGEPTLADVQREFPAYHCWHGASGLCYARPREARPGDPAPVTGEDPPGLRGEIIQHQDRQQAMLRDAVIEEILLAVFGPSPATSVSS
jgi:hypothetical protein